MTIEGFKPAQKHDGFKQGQKLDPRQINAEEKLAEMQEKMSSGKGTFHKIDISASKARRDAFYSDYYAKNPEAASKSGVYPNPNTQPKEAVEAQVTTDTIPSVQEAKVRQSGASKPDWVNFAEYQAKTITDSFAAHAKAEGFDFFDYDEFYARELETWMTKGESIYNNIAKNQPGGTEAIKSIWQAAGYGLNDRANPTESWDELVASGKAPKATTTTVAASEEATAIDEEWAVKMARQVTEAITKHATIDVKFDDIFNDLLALYQDVQKNGWTKMTAKAKEIDPLTEINVDEIIGTDKANTVVKE